MIRNQAAAFADKVRELHITYSGQFDADRIADRARQLYDELAAHRGELVLEASHDLIRRGRGQTVLDRIYRLTYTVGAPDTENLSGLVQYGEFPIIPGDFHQAYRSTGWDNSWNFADTDKPIHLGWPPLERVDMPLNLAEGVAPLPWSTGAPLLYREVIVGTEAVNHWFNQRGTSMVELFNQLRIRLDDQVEAARLSKATS